MCGIAGVVGGDPRTLERMLDRLAHRGPDGRASANGQAARMGCTRLAIRGGAAGAQPLRTRTGLLAFNGEIYNLAELVKDCAWHGIEVDPESDTQVVGALLDIYGIRAVDRLNGMFALSFDDGERVHLARDPAGIKPLYYRGSRFASEIEPLLLGKERRLCSAAVARWLTFHVAWGEETFFEGVSRVVPGGIVTLPGGALVRAGDPALRPGAANPALDADRLRRVVSRAVRDTATQAACGVSLSGGLDSTLVAALLPRENLVAFHGRVREAGCDESGFARAAAQALGLELVEVPITAEACLEAFPRVVEALEEPVAGPGSIAQWLVARAAAQRVKVLYSGCGGDELFGGYARCAAMAFDRPPAGLEAYAPLFARAAGCAFPAGRALALLDRRPGALFSADFLAAHPAPAEEFQERFFANGLEPLAAAARAEREVVLPGLLQVEDRVTMAFGLEGRVPLLDRRLLKAAGRLGPEQRVDQAGTLKALLRDAAAPLLPPAVRERRDKLGFPLPLGEWLAGPWRGFVLDVLEDRRTKERGIADRDAAKRALDEAGRYDRGLVSLLAFELWCRRYLDE